MDNKERAEIISSMCSDRQRIMSEFWGHVSRMLDNKVSHGKMTVPDAMRIMKQMDTVRYEDLKIGLKFCDLDEVTRGYVKDAEESE